MGDMLGESNGDGRDEDVGAASGVNIIGEVSSIWTGGTGSSAYKLEAESVIWAGGAETNAFKPGVGAAYGLAPTVQLS